MRRSNLTITGVIGAATLLLATSCSNHSGEFAAQLEDLPWLEAADSDPPITISTMDYENLSEAWGEPPLDPEAEPSENFAVFGDPNGPSELLVYPPSPLINILAAPDQSEDQRPTMGLGFSDVKGFVDYTTARPTSVSLIASDASTDQLSEWTGVIPEDGVWDLPRAT